MSMDNKVPAIRFDGFSENWEEWKLSNICSETYGGGTPKTSEVQYWNGSIPWIQSSDLIDQQLTGVMPKKQVTEKGIKFSATKLIPENSIAIVIRVGVGKLAFFSFKYATSQDFLSLSKLNIDHGFGLFSIWKKIQSELHEVQGTSIKGITKEELLAKKITLPPQKKEQTKIGNYFQQLDTLITQHQQKHDKLLNIKKALLEKMFPKQGEDVPEIRFKGFSGKWEEKMLGENVHFSKGQGYSKSDLVKVGSPIILYGRLYTQYQTAISEVDTFVKENNKSTLSKGYEVIVPASGETAEDIARASAVVKPDILLGGDLNIIYPNKGIYSVFLALTLSYGKSQKDLSNRAQGKSVVHVRNDDLSKVEIKYPNRKEQIKISNLFQNLDTLLTQHQTQLNKLKIIKQACLEKMFV